jgi:hypothetical protein
MDNIAEGFENGNINLDSFVFKGSAGETILKLYSHIMLT